MKNLIMFFVAMILLTGCKVSQEQLVNEANLPGRQFESLSSSINDPHSLIKTSNGVYVYKDNVQYNAVDSGSSGKSNSGMGEIKFGPKDI